MLRLARAVALIAKHEPHIQYAETDEIDFNSLSDTTLSLLYGFVFPNKTMANRKIVEKTAEQTKEPAAKLVAANAVQNAGSMDIDKLVTAFMQTLDLNIEMPVHSRNSEIVAVSRHSDSFGIDKLVRMFERTLTGNLHHDEGSFIQIHMPSNQCEGQFTSLLFISRDLCMKLVCLIQNIICGRYNSAVALSLSNEEATITEIDDDCEQLSRFIEGNETGSSVDDSDTYDADDDDSSECASDEQPLSPNSLQTALYELYHSGNANFERK